METTKECYLLFWTKPGSDTQQNSICEATYQLCQKLSKYIFTKLSERPGWSTRPIFKQSLTGVTWEISFSKTGCLTKAGEHNLPYNLLIDGGRIIESIPFPRVLVLCEMQSVSSRIWTRVTVSIFYDNYHYSTSTNSPSKTNKTGGAMKD